jgi:hypothetical protein
MTPRDPIYAGHRQFAKLSPVTQTTTPPPTSGLAAPSLRHMGRRHWHGHGGDDPYRRHRSAHRALCQCVNAKLTVPPG